MCRVKLKHLAKPKLTVHVHVHVYQLWQGVLKRKYTIGKYLKKNMRALLSESLLNFKTVMILNILRNYFMKNKIE